MLKVSSCMFEIIKCGGVNLLWLEKTFSWTGPETFLKFDAFTFCTIRFEHAWLHIYIIPSMVYTALLLLLNKFSSHHRSTTCAADSVSPSQLNGNKKLNNNYLPTQACSL